MTHLQTHKMVHSGDKPHMCEECGKTFIQLGNLKRHKLVHSGVKAHKCDLCGRAFALKATLVSHKLMPHVSNPVTFLDKPPATNPRNTPTDTDV